MGRYAVKKINLNLSPPEGYEFRETDGTLLVGTSWRGLVRVVAKYRAGAKLPPGNPFAEIMEQACRRNPSLCTESNTVPYPQQTKDPRSGIKLRVMHWLVAWGKQARSLDGIRFVDAETARKRADVCAKCPRNALLPTGCGACRKSLASLRSNVIGGHRATDGRLGGCDVLGSDLPAAVHLDEIRIDDTNLPAECWRKVDLK